jgi:ASC-1-like (ASCH) protein
MDHVAIMRKSWGLVPKILAGEKTIESRWYKNKVAPWGKINPGEVVYFKNTGEKVSVRVRVRNILNFEKLTHEKAREILEKYGRQIGITDVQKYFEMIKDKKYCLLIFLDKPEMVEPFDIDKTGFGAMAAWMCVEDIEQIKTLGPKNR